MVELLSKPNHTMVILLSLSVVLLAGFLLTRVTKLAKLPDVTGYILAGILIGPYVLKLVPAGLINDMGFISDIALAFIAFELGRFFRKETFQEAGFGVITITLMESLLAGVVVTLSMHYLFHIDWNFSLLLGAIGTATALASTTVTIRQYHARGNFVNILLQVVALEGRRMPYRVRYRPGHRQCRRWCECMLLRDRPPRGLQHHRPGGRLRRRGHTEQTEDPKAKR